MNIIKSRNAAWFLLLNAILWGSSYIWSKMLLGYLPYFTILFSFSLGGLLILGPLFHKRIRGIRKKTVILGIGISGFSIGSNIFCLLALQGTSSSNTAFIVQLSVIITPILMSLAKRELPGSRAVFGAFAALAGLFLLTCDFRSFSLNPGDLYALGNALFFSLYLVALKLYSGNTDPVQFTFVQHAAGTVVFLVLMLSFDIRRLGDGRMDGAGLAILLLSIVISVATILIQSGAIQYVRPEKATLIYTLEPVTATVLAYFFTGEKLAGMSAFAGCALILLAIGSSVYKIRSTQTRPDRVKYTYLRTSEEMRRKGA